MQTTIYLARHATPDRSRSDLSYHLPPGPPLTPEGKREAAALGLYLKEAGVRRVFTSPLQRCLDTARIAAGAAGVDYEIVSALTEWQPGENYQTVARRMWPTFEAARLAFNQGAPVVLITHGGPIAALLLQLGMDHETLTVHRVYDNNNPLPPAGVWEVAQNQDRDCWNTRLVFLPGAQPSP